MKIKVREITEGCKFEIIQNGDCIDLKAAEDYEFVAPQAGRIYQKDNNKQRNVKFDEKMIKLGIAMQLPKGFVAKLRQRSSTTKKLRLLPATSGFIDTTYSGNDDEWCYYCLSVANTTIHKGDRICQFEIQLSQFATVWQKLKWLFNGKPQFVWVDKLEGPNRGGHGSTGIK